MVAKLFTKPFGVAGDKTPIPNGVQTDGTVSYESGFGADYERQLGVDPAAKNIGRQTFNELMYDATLSLQEMQAGVGTSPYNLAFAQSLPGGGYAKGAVIPRAAANGFWVCTVPNNATNPDTGGAGWTAWNPPGSLYAVDTGTATAYVCAFVPAITVRSEAQQLTVRIKTTNTGAATFNDGIGAVPLLGQARFPLQGGELIANGIAQLQWVATASSYVVLYCTGGAFQVAPAAQSAHAVQRSQLGSYGSSQLVTASTVLTVGAFYTVNAAGVTAGLPALSTTISGDSIAVTARFDTIIAANGPDYINSPAMATSTNSVTIRAGEQVQLISNGATGWALTSFTKNPQYQEYTAFTTAGTAAALTLTPIPAIPAYTTPLRFNVRFSQASTPTSTINVSGLGTRLIKQYDSAGVKISAVYSSGQMGDLVYDGTDWVLLNQLPNTTIPTRQSYRGTTNLKGSANGTTASIPYTIGEAIVAAATGPSVVLAGVSLTLNAAATASATVSGMVGGAATAGTWYATYLIYNPTTSAMVLTGDPQLTSPSAAPAAGFTHWVRIGSWRAETGGIPRRFIQSDSSITINPLAGTNVPAALVMVSGAMGSVNTPTWGAVPIGAFVPTTASKIRIFANSYAGPVIVAPNPSYSGLSIASVRGAPIMLSTPEGYTANQAAMGEFVIESPNLYYACTNANGGLMCMGYEDTI